MCSVERVRSCARMNGENANVARLFTAICHASKNLKALTSSSSFIFLYEYSVMIHDSPHYSDSRNVLTQHLIDLIRRGSTNESKTCTAIRHWAPLAGDGCRSALGRPSAPASSDVESEHTRGRGGLPPPMRWGPAAIVRASAARLEATRSCLAGDAREPRRRFATRAAGRHARSCKRDERK